MPALTESNFDQNAIAEVARKLRLTWPVKIVLKGELKSRVIAGARSNGCRFSGEGEHVIELDATRSADDVNRTLAHELWHCVQAERHGSEWGRVYTAAREGSPNYWANPFERVAARCADAIVTSGIRMVVTA